MHLAIISPYPPAITGIGQYGYAISQALAKSEAFYKITILAGETDRQSKAETNAGMHSAIHLEYTWKTNQIDIAPRILNRLKSIKPDLVWFNLGLSSFGLSPLANLSGFFIPFFLRKRNLPTITTLHEMIDFVNVDRLAVPGGKLVVAGARLLTRLAVFSDVLCLTMNKYICGLKRNHPGHAFVHIPIGAPVQPIKLPRPRSPERILFVSTLAPFKGIETLIEAFSTIKKDFTNLHLTIAGAEHPRFRGYKEKLQEEYRTLPDLQLIIQPSDQMISECFQKAHVVVIPYTASTGSSSVLFHAIAMGRPVILSNLPDLEQTILENGLKASFFTAGQPASLAEKLNQALKEPEFFENQVNHNFPIIYNLRPERICSKYIEAFNQAFEVRHIPKKIT